MHSAPPWIDRFVVLSRDFTIYLSLLCNSVAEVAVQKSPAEVLGDSQGNL